MWLHVRLDMKARLYRGKCVRAYTHVRLYWLVAEISVLQFVAIILVLLTALFELVKCY
jgi:hypothetical protein